MICQSGARDLPWAKKCSRSWPSKVSALGQSLVVHGSFRRWRLWGKQGWSIPVLGKQGWSFCKWRLMGKQWWSSATLYKGSPFVGGGSWPSSASYIAAFGRQRKFFQCVGTAFQPHELHDDKFWHCLSISLLGRDMRVNLDFGTRRPAANKTSPPYPKIKA